MAWVVDTCVVIDVLEGDPKFGHVSAPRKQLGVSSLPCALPSGRAVWALLLQKLLSAGLTLCPVTMVELGAAFDCDLAEQKFFLDQAGIRHADDWNPTDTERAHNTWATYVRFRRTAGTAKRPNADILIGAFACRFDGLITRNPDDFKPWYPKLKVRVP